jgi:hypothetical protein
LREFGQVIVRKHLWGLLDQIKIKLPKYLSGQVGLISVLSKLLIRILSNSNKKFEKILIPIDE